MPTPRISRAVATPMPPKPKMPHVRPMSEPVGVNWLKAPRRRLSCSSTRCLAAASAMASACSAMASAKPPPLVATGTPGGSSPSGTKSTPAITNWISRACASSAASPGRRSLAVLTASSTCASRTAAARAASSSSVK
jgi:hypothetical protein